MLPLNIDNMMSHTSRLILAASMLAAFFSGCDSQRSPTSSSYSDQPNGDAETEQVDFAKEILPILERSCFPCHGPKMSPVSMAGFRVDLREHAVGREKIIPGDPDESLFIKKLITGENSERMPPLKSDNPQLSNEQIELLKRWIKEGASYDTQEDEPEPDDALGAIDRQRSSNSFSVASTETLG
ncbi:MAG: c-type cytochrome domain-containing protein [Fuerstiella sp.]